MSTKSKSYFFDPVEDPPDDDMTVLLRLDHPDWPIIEGWKDGPIWRDCQALEITAKVIGWMDMHDAAEILEGRHPKRKGGR